MPDKFSLQLTDEVYSQRVRLTDGETPSLLITQYLGEGRTFADAYVSMSQDNAEAMACSILSENYVITPKNEQVTYAKFKPFYCKNWNASPLTLYRVSGMSNSGASAWIMKDYAPPVCVPITSLEFVRV
jgi:hypothetical protein